uniref:SUI1 domain-containing protein n=1 Tax=Salix viminalis TaxID=40686 RepID=A0A6N2MEW4_SALVM
MFKKAIEAKSHQRLSGADRKKLKRTIRDRFPRASDADIDALLPPKAEITVSKFVNRVHLYGVEGSFPMFFDVDGRGSEIFPTVFALWNVPEMLPSFILKGGEVSQFIIGGADLMFPGINIPAEGLPSFLAGEPWAVKVPGNPSPIAVGSTTMSTAEALKAGMRGKALRITHYYRDLLWESVEGHYVPNAGFLEDVVFEDPVFLSSVQVPYSCEGSGDSSNHENDGVDGKEVRESAISDCHPTSKTQLDSDIVEQVTTVVGGFKVTDNIAADESTTVEEQHTLSAEDLDAYLDKCLLQALHTTVNDKDLPMPGSTLWAFEEFLSFLDGRAAVANNINMDKYCNLPGWKSVKPMSKSIVVLDPTLCDALFKGAIKKGSAYPTEIHKKDLGSTFVSRMQAHHIVTRGSESVVRKGSVRTIQILTERRQGNKKVTKLSGMETFLMDADALASELQKKFACSTSVTVTSNFFHCFALCCIKNIFVSLLYQSILVSIVAE